MPFEFFSDPIIGFGDRRGPSAPLSGLVARRTTSGRRLAFDRFLTDSLIVRTYSFPPTQSIAIYDAMGGTDDESVTH